MTGRAATRIAGRQQGVDKLTSRAGGDNLEWTVSEQRVVVG